MIRDAVFVGQIVGDGRVCVSRSSLLKILFGQCDDTAETVVPGTRPHPIDRIDGTAR
jgi:hypothetical protein